MPYNTYGRRPNMRRRHVSSARKTGKNLKQNIHPSQFIKPAKAIEVEKYQPTHMFGDFDLHPLLQRNITAKGFTAPSKIQDLAIPHGLTGKDVVGIANTGTGKTTAFALPLLNRILNDKASRALILAPTRELAQQIEDECRSFAKGSGLFGALIIGGSHMGRQIHDLRLKPNIVIATPGRLKDHAQQGTVNLSSFNIIVLDEVDRRVDMGFINDIRFILGELPEQRQSLFFSATMDPKIESLMQTFLKSPVTISAKTHATSDHVDQNVVHFATREERLEKLHEILMGEHVLKALIFEETKHGTERLSTQLTSRGFKVDALHGNKNQSQRSRALQRFRNNDVTVLVATDVAARGIDVSDITHVINYSTPKTYDDYVHRIGRAGRAGKQGYALTFIEGLRK